MSEEIKKNPPENDETEVKKTMTDNEEIKAFQKEVMGKLDNPLIVHKKSDASYQEDTSAYEMNQTHNEEERPTLERHRFKKEQKNKGGTVAVLLLVLIICAGVFAGLYYTDNLPFLKEKEETTVAEDVTETTTDIAEKYVGTIVVKDTYIFVNGREVDGIEGLQNEIKYEDASTTAFEIIDEHANSDFLNYDILPILTDLGFFGKDTKVTHLDSTGLMAAAETTTAAPETEAPTEAPTEAETEQVSE